MASSGKLNNAGIDLVKEVKHRQTASATGGDSTLDDVEEYNRPFQTDDQQVFLWHMANVQGRPKSVRPAFRLLGLFPSVQEAQAHGMRIVRAEPDSPCALRISSVNAWYSIPQNHFDDIEPHRLKVNRNLETHAKKLADAEANFTKRKKWLTRGSKPSYQGAAKQAAEQNERRREMSDARAKLVEAEDVEALRALELEEAQAEIRRQRDDGGVEESKGGDEDDAVDEAYEEEPLPRPPPAETLDENWEQQVTQAWGGNGVPALPVGREAEVRSQKFASVSVLYDYEGEGAEPAIVVYAAFDTEAEALKYNKKVVAKEVKDHDVAVVSLYEWLYPHLMVSDKVEQLYRNDVLNRIMKHTRTSAQTVRNFERECAEKQMDVPTTEVSPDLSEPAPRLYRAPVGSGLDAPGENDALAPSDDKAE